MSVLETPFTAAHLRAVVSLAALRWNLAWFGATLPAGTELIACVKANAYGHGLRAVAACLEAEGVRWLSLGSPAEAVALRQLGHRLRHPPVPDRRGRRSAPLLEAGITVGIQSFEEAAALAQAARARPPSIFLKVDSGLGRVGVPLEDAARAGGAHPIERSRTSGWRASSLTCPSAGATERPGSRSGSPSSGGSRPRFAPPPTGRSWCRPWPARASRAAWRRRRPTPSARDSSCSASSPRGFRRPSAHAPCSRRSGRPRSAARRPAGHALRLRAAAARHPADPARHAAHRLLELHPPPEGGAEGPRGAVRTRRCSRSPWSTPSWT